MPEATAHTARPRATSLSLVGPVVIGLGALLVVAAPIFWAVGDGIYSPLATACRTDRCPSNAMSRGASVATWDALTNLSLFSGIATAATGVVLTVLLRVPASAERPAMSFVPDPAGRRLVLVGSF